MNAPDANAPDAQAPDAHAPTENAPTPHAPTLNTPTWDLDILSLATAYRRRRTTPTEVTRHLLERIEKGAVFRLVTAERAMRQAARAEALFGRGVDLGPLQGVPIALKDLMDTQGDVTSAGSAVLEDAPAAAADCPVAARLDAAGAVFLGKTTMTELAFSGLGLNQHAPIPGNPLDASRVTGGSSSGSAASVGYGLASFAVGSDTGGSVRIPAAFTGLVGLKPTERSLPLDGVVPACPTHDTLGPITRTVADAWHAWQAMRGEAPRWFAATDVHGLELFAPTTVLRDDLDPEVRTGFERGVALLEALGATVRHGEAPSIARIDATYGREHSINSVEYGAAHAGLARRYGGRMDPRVVRRLLASAACTAGEYLELLEERERLKRAFWDEVAGAGLTAGTHVAPGAPANADVAAVIAPTVPILPPLIAPLLAGDDDVFGRANLASVRNARVVNYLGAPAVSVPVHTTAEGLSVGLMVVTRPGQEHLALSIAAAVEAANAG